jgi:hypothetical protein
MSAIRTQATRRSLTRLPSKPRPSSKNSRDSMRINADPERIAPTVASIDFAGLAALLPK